MRPILIILAIAINHFAFAVLAQPILSEVIDSPFTAGTNPVGMLLIHLEHF